MAEQYPAFQVDFCDEVEICNQDGEERVLLEFLGVYLEIEFETSCSSAVVLLLASS